MITHATVNKELKQINEQITLYRTIIEIRLRHKPEWNSKFNIVALNVYLDDVHAQIPTLCHAKGPEAALPILRSLLEDVLTEYQIMNNLLAQCTMEPDVYQMWEHHILKQHIFQQPLKINTKVGD